MPTKDIKRVVEKVISLPTLPSVVTRLISMVNDPNTTATHVNKIILNDPSLSAKVLRLVNSAYYGLSNSVSSITQAVVILGFNTIRSLSLSASVFDTFAGGGDENYFDRGKFWEHSTGVSVIGKVLAASVPGVDPEEAFVAGLLHDIGKVVADKFMNDDFKEVLSRVKSEDIYFIEAEQAVWGVTHSEIGGWLGEKWKLPKKLVETIKFHHDPDKCSSDNMLPSIINIADAICKIKGIGSGGDDKFPELREDIWQKMKIPNRGIVQIMKKIDTEVENAKIMVEMAKGN